MGNFGLTNPYLKFGVALLVLGALLFAAPFVLEQGQLQPVLRNAGLVVFLAGAVMYIGGRIAKTVRAAAGRSTG